MYLGIEIGGTKLQLGIGPGDGTLRGLWRGAVEVAAGADGIRRQITAAVPELLQKAELTIGDLRGVGIGFGGPVDDATRTVIKSHQIQGWDGFPLADWISDMLGLPTVLGNDADCAGLAEALFGAGKGLSPIFYITIGSGIGGGLIIDGEIYRGCGRGAAEIGHLQVFAEGTERDHYMMPLEEAASGWSIAERGRGWVEVEFRDSPLHRLAGRDPAQVTGQMVAEAARQGDREALGIIYAARNALAQAICQTITLLCPRRIIIGGGVSLIGEELLFRPVREFVARDSFRPFADCYDIVPAALGEEVVIHGALALARKKLQGASS
ncbi:MAG: ROK family protein [Gemmataceae bacterium]|nr:ROK family protein [Gemmataceae bacterium]